MQHRPQPKSVAQREWEGTSQQDAWLASRWPKHEVRPLDAGVTPVRLAQHAQADACVRGAMKTFGLESGTQEPCQVGQRHRLLQPSIGRACGICPALALAMVARSYPVYLAISRVAASPKVGRKKMALGEHQLKSALLPRSLTGQRQPPKYPNLSRSWLPCLQTGRS
jgi:hypothetical protein